MKLNNKGFTLVELLAVIVVLALLMVVATRSIGGSLDNAKKSAMESEAKKIVSKTYEDLQTASLMGQAVSYTYNGVASSSGYTDGDYNVKVTVSGSEITDVCIKYGSGSNVKYGKGKVSVGVVNFAAGTGYYLYTSTAC